MSIPMFVARRLVRRELSQAGRSIVLTKERREEIAEQLEERGITAGDVPVPPGVAGDLVRRLIL